jgi:hypothetical protein
VLPLLPIVGAVQDPRATRGRHKPFYCLRDVTTAVRAGEQLPALRASQNAIDQIERVLKGSLPVTITLREAEHWAHRNSNVPAWCKFAKDLMGKGEQVIILRDTAQAGAKLPSFATMPGASLSVDIRLALYQRAKCNMSVANGPHSMTLFGYQPLLQFIKLNADDVYEPNRPEWWPKFHGISEGEQFPWSNPDQRIVWKEDSYENLCEAWEALECR